MAVRELERESHDSYFIKATKTEDSILEEKGTREMFPLRPFIVSGGRNTERYYFFHVSNLSKYQFSVVPEYFGSESQYTEVFPQRIARIFEKNDGAKVYCVYDWDTVRGHKSRLESHDSFVAAIKPWLQTGDVVLCPSMPCFEYWIYLHFVSDVRLFSSYGKISQQLAQYIKPCFPDPRKALKKLLKSEACLKDETWVRNLIKDGKLEAAISRSKNNIATSELKGNLEMESYSFVYRAFEYYL